MFPDESTRIRLLAYMFKHGQQRIASMGDEKYQVTLVKG